MPQALDRNDSPFRFPVDPPHPLAQGAIATGGSLIQAFDRLEVAEHGARGLVACRTLGEVVPIDDAQIEAITAAFGLPR